MVFNIKKKKNLLKYFLKFIEGLIKKFNTWLLKYIAFFKTEKLKKPPQNTFNVILECNNYLVVPVVWNSEPFSQGYIIMDWIEQEIGVDRCSPTASPPFVDWW